MKVKRICFSLLAGALLIGALTLPATAAPVRVYVNVAPPPVVVETRGVAPGRNYVWIGGFHRWDGRAYAWVPGRWEKRPRARAVWVSGRWARHHTRGWYWIDGHWR